MIRLLKDFFKHNKIQKIAALVISASLWVYVMGSQDPVMSSSYKVHVSLANPSLINSSVNTVFKTTKSFPS